MPAELEILHERVAALTDSYNSLLVLMTQNNLLARVEALEAKVGTGKPAGN